MVRNNNNTEQYQQMLKQFGNQDVKVTRNGQLCYGFSMGTLIFSTLLGIIGMLIIKGRPILAGCLLIVATLVGIFNMSLMREYCGLL